MAIIKCKMCGGALNLVEGASTAECEFCGSVQTIPNLDDEKKLIQFERAERLRKQCEFDKAAGIYETIAAEFRQEAEAYWGLVLCKYGIEYVDDPATGKKIPTCHRSSFDSIMEDSDFEQALENADTSALRVYRQEAKEFERIRKGILEVSSSEKPYDIFICYKETDENGDRTLDSVLAQDLYAALTDKGYRVFFSRITLQGKLGEAYEPYIFAALHSAKVMLAVGTCYEYYNAVWVKNEWSRYLKICQADKSKHLIPCYKSLDPEDMPKEFNHLQGADLGKMGAIQDILFNLEKYIPLKKEAAAAETQTAASSNNPTTESYLKRVFLFLEDGEWEDADEYCEKVLDIDPENPRAYLGKLMAQLKVSKQADLGQQDAPLEENGYYKKALRFAGDALYIQLEGYVAVQKKRAATQKQETNTQQATAADTRWKQFQNWISAGHSHTLVMLVDGTAVAVGNNTDKRCNVDPWQDLVSVSAGETHSVGLHRDGTVVAVGSTSYGKCSVDHWKDIIEISASERHTIGLRKDGTVVATPFTAPKYEYYGQCDVSDWKDIIAVSAGTEHTVGLRKNGTVAATKYTGNRLLYFGQCDVGSWNNITAIGAGDYHTVGLRRDGTVVAAGRRLNGRCKVDTWRNIVAISVGSEHTVGLRSNGTVVATGVNSSKQCDVNSWRNIVAISAGAFCTIGLCRDGTLVSTHLSGLLNSGQCNVDGLKLFHDPDHLDEERAAALKNPGETDQNPQKIRLQRRNAGKCQHCGGTFKSGFWDTKCISCGKMKDY